MLHTVHENVEFSLYALSTDLYDDLHLIDLYHPHWTMSYVQSGEVTMSSAGETWLVQAGDVMLHPPKVKFSEQAMCSGIHQWIMFDAKILSNVDLFDFYPATRVLSVPKAMNFSSLFRRLEHIWYCDLSPARSIQILSMTLQLCGIVLECWQTAGSISRLSTGETQQDRFVHVIRFMHDNLEQKILREDLAELVHLHPIYFDRSFQKIYSCSPIQMLRRLRLQKAQQLLESSELPLQVIATRCGFTDAPYFHRVFRQYYGQSPGHYRQSVKSARTGYLFPL